MMTPGHPPIWWAGAAPALDAHARQGLAVDPWDLVVVGGGIVGLCSAISAAQSGRRVCLLEAGEVGKGTTSRSTVKVTSGHGGLTADIAKRHGLDVAAAYQRRNDSGFHLLAGLVERLSEDVGWTPTQHVVHASESAATSRLLRAVEVARAAGVLVEPARPPEWGGGEAWAWTSAALVQPLSLARALARLAMTIGVRIVENCRVEAVRNAGDHLIVEVDEPIPMRCDYVLMATQAPIHDPDLHAFRASFIRHWGIAVPDAGAGPDATYDLDPGGLSTRSVQLPDGRPGRVVVGLSKRVGQVKGPDPYDDLLSRAARSGIGAEIVSRWAAHDVKPPDLLPYVGPTRRDPRVIMATGLNSWGFTNAAAIAGDLPVLLATLDEHEAALRQESGADGGDGADDPWRARRIVPHGGAMDVLSLTSWLTRSEAGDTIGAVVAGARPTSDGLPGPGEGVVEGGPVHPRAVCRTSDGVLHAVSARCTHAGCLVRWNRWDENWECPCHGSRFGPDGDVLQGPANRALESVVETASSPSSG